ncbi:halocyanin domain-containing protein [Halorubrum vacuolatum]|uniref:Halocyanin domain-containing protein n=1 Tax=Halorubrum vacuolatum TaxID=63740 RepID=A0A238VD39_HALVU|nr:halocyanin domain-containing protein [Halorubrum vacuolatum]SNR32084.1 halocyanin domain-containing protein [Halorubrum vacuolatum]
MDERTRRGFVGAAGALSVVALAGCLGDDDDGDGDVVDLTGEETVDVVVGAGNGLEFDPVDIVIDVGTTVIWEWTGDGGAHDVVDVDGAFESDLVDEAGYTFEHTFEETGFYEYVCTPHQTSGMVGTVEVVD